MEPFSPTVGILATQGNVGSHARVLGGLGAGVREVRTPAQLKQVDGLVIPGGESTTMWLGLDRDGMWGPLREFRDSGKPIFGTCAGLIMLANTVLDGEDGQQTIGGMDITVRRNAFGRQVDSFEQDIAVQGIDGEPVHAIFIRAPWVERVGAEVTVLAEVDGYPVAVRQGTLLGISFHPELADPVEPRIHAMFLEMASIADAGWARPVPARAGRRRRVRAGHAAV